MQLDSQLDAEFFGEAFEAIEVASRFLSCACQRRDGSYRQKPSRTCLMPASLQKPRSLDTASSGRVASMVAMGVRRPAAAKSFTALTISSGLSGETA